MKQRVVVLVWDCGCTQSYREMTESLALCRVTSLMVRFPQCQVVDQTNPDEDFRVLVEGTCIGEHS